MKHTVAKNTRMCAKSTCVLSPSPRSSSHGCSMPFCMKTRSAHSEGLRSNVHLQRMMRMQGRSILAVVCVHVVTVTDRSDARQPPSAESTLHEQSVSPGFMLDFYITQMGFKHLIAKILPTFSPVLGRGIHNSLQVVIAGGHHNRPRRPIHLLPALHDYLQSNVHAL